MSTPTKFLTGKHSINCDHRPAVPNDSIALLNQIGITDAKLLSSYTIKNDQEYVAVANLVQVAASRQAAIEAGYEDIKDLANRIHKTICQHENEDKALWSQIQTVGRNAIAAFRRKQDEEKRRAELKAAEEARQAQLEADKVAAEIRKRAEEEALALKMQGEARAARETQKEAEKQAQTIIAEADDMQDIGVIEPSAPRVSGVSDSRRWKAEITDQMEFLKEIVANRAPSSVIMKVRGKGEQSVPLVEINQTALNFLAQRIRKTDLGFRGVIGVRDVSVRVSKKENMDNTIQLDPIDESTEESEAEPW